MHLFSTTDITDTTGPTSQRNRKPYNESRLFSQIVSIEVARMF